MTYKLTCGPNLRLARDSSEITTNFPIRLTYGSKNDESNESDESGSSEEVLTTPTTCQVVGQKVCFF
jgi:hypothetical protein